MLGGTVRATMLLVPLLLAACGPKPPPVRPVPQSLSDVCSAGRAGERPLLLTEAVSDELHAWLDGFIAPAATPGEARARAESALASFRALEDPDTVSSLGMSGIVVLYLQVLEAVWLLEPLWPADAVDPPLELAVLLEPVYEGLRLPAVFSGGFVQQLGGVVMQILAETDASNDLITAALQLLRILPERARILQRHVALPLVCGDGTPPDAALDALRHLVDAAVAAGDWEEGLVLQREVVRRAPEDVEEAFALALTAYRAGRVGNATGRRPLPTPLQRGVFEPSGDLERYAAARVIARSAELVIEVSPAGRRPGHGGAQRRAKDLWSVAAELPDDARPLTGLARR